MTAMVWLRNYFVSFGDHQPNGELIRVSAPTKREVWVEYKRAQERKNCAFVKCKRFSELWAAIFPEYQLEKYVNVPGKCDTCFEINARRSAAKSGVVREALKDCHAMHRAGFFMPERLRLAFYCLCSDCVLFIFNLLCVLFIRYQEKVCRAMDNPGKVMSLILDGMDQAHSRVPHMANISSFGHPLRQHVQGVLVHGEGVTFYRTFNNVAKGADLTTFCFLDVLEKWFDKYKSFPEEIYFQIDGGSENANQYVLGICELLIAKRMVRKIVLARLPKGHTHADIDAIFAHLWTWLRSRSVLTVSEFKDHVEEHFKETKLNVSIDDIYVIPDYQRFFNDENCIDQKLSGYAKQEKTQLCWTFEAVVKNDFFKHGCKTTYRAFCSDTIIEFQKRLKSEALSRVGQLTGLEPVQVSVINHPAADSDPNRPGIEGFYLLTKIPGEENPNIEFMPKPFVPSSGAEIEQTLRNVVKQWPLASCPIREKWDNWSASHSPGRMSADEYIVSKPSAFRVPLRDYLEVASTICRPDWANIIRSNPVDGDELCLPVVLAACMPSVATRFNAQTAPPPPRIYAFADQAVSQVVEGFTDRTQAYYNTFLCGLSSLQLKSILSLRKTHSGHPESVQGTKSELIGRIYQSDRSRIAILHRKPIPLAREAIERNFTQYLPNRDAEMAAVVETMTKRGVLYKLSKLDFKTFLPAQPITANGMNHVLGLMQHRADEICYDFDVTNPTVQPRRCRSLYMSTNTWRNGVLDPGAFPSMMAPYGGAEALSRVDIIYVTTPPSADQSSWSVLTIDLHKKTATSYYPTEAATQPADYSARVAACMNAVRTALNSLSPNTLQDPLIVTNMIPNENAPYEYDQTDFDSGMFIITYLNYHHHRLPIAFTSRDMATQRINIADGVLHGAL